MKKLNELINKKKRVESDYLILQKTHDETQMRLRGELNVSKQYKVDESTQEFRWEINFFFVSILGRYIKFK